MIFNRQALGDARRSVSQMSEAGLARLGMLGCIKIRHQYGW